MDGNQLFMYRIGYHARLLLGIGAPKQKNDRCFLTVKLRNYPVGKYFPALILMAVGLPRANRQHRIEQQDSLPCSARKVAVLRHCNTQIIGYFLIYINE